MQLCLPHTAWQLDSAMKPQIVSPNGEFLALNEGQNQDIFWATRSVSLFSSFFFLQKKNTDKRVRDREGSTFGIITSVTVQARPPLNFLTTEIIISTPSGNPSFYPTISHFFSQFPILSSLVITSYNFVAGTALSTAPTMPASKAPLFFPLSLPRTPLPP